MDSRESLLQQHQTQHHHQQQLPPAPARMMMMSSNLYTHHQLPNNSTTNNNNNSSSVSHESMQQRYGDGSSPPGGFRAGGFNIEPARKKRGRPRKYSPSDGNIALGLAPSPVTTGGGGSFNGGGDGGGTSNTDLAAKKQRGRPPGSGKKQLDALGEMLCRSSSPGVGFTPHVVTVDAGEDIASKITAFSQQGPRSVCILSANGAISNVTLRQPAMSGGTVTYEGRFEIISLSGSFMLTDSNVNDSSRSSGLSVSLAGSDDRVLGGGVVGSLVAATPIQVVVGSFIADAKKPKSSSTPTSSPPGNMLTFGGGGGSVPCASPASDGPSSESSHDSGSSPLHRHPGSYNNTSRQPPPPPPPPPPQMQQMYSNMGWPNSTMNMLHN